MTDERQRHPAEGLQFEQPSAEQLLSDAVKVIEWYADLSLYEGVSLGVAPINEDRGLRARDFLAMLGR